MGLKYIIYSLCSIFVVITLVICYTVVADFSQSDDTDNLKIISLKLGQNNETDIGIFYYDDGLEIDDLTFPIPVTINYMELFFYVNPSYTINPPSFYEHIKVSCIYSHGGNDYELSSPEPDIEYIIVPYSLGHIRYSWENVDLEIEEVTTIWFGVYLV